MTLVAQSRKLFLRCHALTASMHARVEANVAELPLRNLNESGIIPHFRDTGMGIELSAFWRE